MIVEAIGKVVQRENLVSTEAALVMEEIMSGEATEAQIAALITALRMKGETVAEISGFAQVMREKAIRIKVEGNKVVDTCGTGGDISHTFNISTAAAFVVAGAGVKVAKHGNRSVSSSCGSADVLETLGVKIDVPPEKVEECLNQIGIGFLFAPLLHQAMKYAIGPRRQIGIRTVFNILGPLTNPAGASAQVLGVYDGKLTEVMAKVLGNLGVKHALVVHGTDGLDEISTVAPTKVSELVGGKVSSYEISPEMFGLPQAKIADLKGGTVEDNGEILKSILSGETGPKRDIVLMNAAAALTAAGVVPDIKGGIEKAAHSVDSGAAKEKLEKLIEVTNT